MSFGCGVGDFMPVIELANTLRKTFSDSPKQFKAISDDVRGLSIVLMDTEVCYDRFPDAQKKRFQDVIASCLNLLRELDASLQNYCDIKKSADGKMMKRIWKRLTWDMDSVRDFRDRITAQVSILDVLNSQTIRQDVARLVDHQEDQQRQALLNWISEIDYTAQQNDLVSRREPGSRKWLFSSKEYNHWSSEKGSILFCPGMPGAGKTITLAVVVEDLQKKFENDSDSITVFVYCSYRNHDQDITKLLCSLLRSVLQQIPQTPTRALSIYNTHQTRSSSISRTDARDLIRSILSGYARVNILIDALDELPSEVRTPFSSEILRLHTDFGVNLFVTSRDLPNIQSPFSDKGALTLEIKASDEDVRAYLEAHITQLPNFVSRNPDLHQDIINAITDASDGMFLLAELHLKSLQGKKSPRAIRNALEKLSTGSSAYDSAYEEAMNRINSQDDDSEALAKQALVIIICSRRPLMTEELAYAVSIEPQSVSVDEDNVPEIGDIVDVCTGLITVDIQSNVVRLVHKSTQEYFERNKARWFPRANSKMALLCTQYLSLARAAVLISESQSTGSPDISRLGLIQLAKDMSESALIVSCSKGHHAIVDLWLSVNTYDINKKSRQNRDLGDDVLLTIAASRGDIIMIELALRNGADPNIRSFQDQTALYIAAEHGFEDIVAILLHHHDINPALQNIDLNLGKDQSRQKTALEIAATKGNIGCCRLLLERAGHEEISSALYLAAEHKRLEILSEFRGWLHSDVLSALLRRAVNNGDSETAIVLMSYCDRNHLDGNGISVICLAYERNRLDIVKHLLSYKDCSWEELEKVLVKVLLAANIKALKLLLPYVDINADISRHLKQSHPVFPLHLAARVPDASMTILLLSREDINVNAVDYQVRTAFLLAAEEGNDRVMEALLGSGKDIEIEKMDINSKSAYDYIHLNHRNSRIFNILFPFLEDDINKTDVDGFTLLHRLCRLPPVLDPSWGDGEHYILRDMPSLTNHLGTILRVPGLDINFPDRDGNTALFWAIRTRQTDSVRCLLQRPEIIVGHNFLALLSSSPTPGLQFKSSPAVENPFTRSHKTTTTMNEEDDKILDSILAYISTNKGASTVSLNSQDEKGTTLLSWAAKNNRSDEVEKLLDLPHIDANLADHCGRTPLAHATSLNRAECVEVLLRSSNVDANLADNDGNTPLHYSPIEHNPFIRDTSCLDLLLSNSSTNVNAYNRDGDTPLILAIKRQNSYLVKIFAGCVRVDPNFPGRNGVPPLLYAMTLNNTHIVEHVLGIPTIKIDVCDYNGRTTLSYFDSMWERFRAKKMHGPYDGWSGGWSGGLLNIARRLRDLSRVDDLRQGYKKYLET
ncbi:Ankyrin-2-like protein [Cladobotryum mycophilum]|uniref:Ankyrin-2-like protein n=1 Tax=Cladobotryum mycophilum TaxID=491253 RepID=A0ABR0SPZ5_9HYPO